LKESASFTSDDLLFGAPASQLLVLAASALVRCGADMATAQVVRPRDGSLLLVAHVGFRSPFVDHFSIVKDLRRYSEKDVSQGRFLQVDDIADHPIFNGTTDQQVIMDAGSRSFTVFAVRGSGGELLGVLAAHFRTPGPHNVDFAEPITGLLESLLSAPPVSAINNYQYLTLQNLALREALSNRGIIGMAKGILMASSNLDEHAAFQMLVKASQRENVKLREICERIVDSHHAKMQGRS
jgi:GAF domain-containing protein